MNRGQSLEDQVGVPFDQRRRRGGTTDRCSHQRGNVVQGLDVQRAGGHVLLNRRDFIRSLAAGAIATPLRTSDGVSSVATGETLYNGITLPAVWPPRRRFADDYPVTAPYLINPPRVISIDVGRQLFVDDFLIQETTMTRTCHVASYHSSTPVLRPETTWEKHDEYADRTNRRPNPTAMVFSDGVFYDPSDRLFKLWYMGGYSMNTCYAVSDDGITWHRPTLDIVPGTNIVTRGGRDSSTVWLDLETGNADERFKMADFQAHTMFLRTSRDGVHWRRVAESGITGDRTTFFYNPFRKVWVYGLRGNVTKDRERFRRYWEHPQWHHASWSGTDPVAWVRADTRDFVRPGYAKRPELYNLDCVAYESLMLGLFTIWRGESAVREKINEITVGFSRDGFHWDRPDRRAFAGVSDTPGSWNWANVQSAGGCCLVVGDALYFYVSGRGGVPGTADPGECATGLAVLRRDGFASMDWLPERSSVIRRTGGAVTGTLLTRPVRFGGSYLFVNADLEGGELRVEVVDRLGQPLRPYTLDACRPVVGDATRLPVGWVARDSLDQLAGQDVRFRFSMTRGRLYAFWVSRWPSGESGGYVAAGGPGFVGPTDTR